ncbi:TonB-dependent receptor [Sphingomonas sp. CFBP 13720]|uniref:TonB-dependent receptor n=1 Tax=Sphingomonas sp. CFBP 13720 TaxID=2775302 RepID=UPI00177E7F68|nr:TonB-dependent receptor [Sphingomonas sp. CFBP 13720]MBD8680106.1 TonB-dependent receptor [Sphingomonas sp. CFBP 13720]
MKAMKEDLCRRQLRLRAGVSAVALFAAGHSASAMAQAEIQSIAPDATQAAAPSQDVGEPATNASSDEIVVTGRRAALEAAVERKRRSETIVDSVVADDAGKLPDNSITEVLQRVSGVSIVRFAALGDPDHFSVQGSGVQVRGLTGVASRLNGREIFSANNGRAILWSDVTPELMAAVDVYKASTADLIEGGTGGQIDLRTKMPFDFNGKFHVAGTAELSVGDMANKADPMGSVLVTDSFETPIGRIGLLADIAFSQFSSLSQFIRTEPYYKTRIGAQDRYIPGGFTYGDEEFQYRRYGIYGAAQWAPSEELIFTATFFQSRYKSESNDFGAQVSSQSLAVDPANSTFDSNGLLLETGSLFNRDTGTFLPGGQVTSSGNKGFVESNTRTRDYSLSFAWAPEDGPFTVKGAIQRVDSRQIYDRIDIFREIGFGQGFGMDLTGNLPRITVSPATQASFANPANYFWSASMPHNERNEGRLDTAQLDAEYKFDSSFFRSVKIGGRYAKRTERDLQNGYNWTPLGRGWNGDPQLTYANAAPGDTATHVFDDFFRGETLLPGNLQFATKALADRFNADRTGLVTPPPAGFCPPGTEFDCSASGPLPRTGYGGLSGIRAPGFILPGDQVDNRTENLAGYALVRFGPQGDDNGISGNVGVRVVNLKNEGSGFIQQNGNTFIRNGQTVTLGQQFIARGGEAEFTRVLPSINLVFAPSDRVKIRGGYNITLDLPSFNALRASGDVGVATTANPVAGQPGIFTNFTASTGNPLLKPTISNNFDLSFEYYGARGTTFHVAPFYKRITDLPIFSLTTRQVPIAFANGTTEIVDATASDFINSEEAAEIKGIEVGGRFFLDMFTGPISGLGFEGNYTFIDSKNPGDLYRDINGVIRNDAPLVGLSKHNANAALLYERNPFSLRIAYSWRSRYLQSTNSNGTNPTYNYYATPGVATPIQIALPVYSAPYGTLDAGVRFKVTENFSFGIQGTNLTATTAKTVMGGYPDGVRVGRSWFQSDRRISTGINLSF